MPDMEYRTPAFAPTVPGADWFIEGRRYQETGREATETGYRLTLERADADPGLGYMALKES